MTSLLDYSRRSKRIALIGASPNPARPSNGVMQFLLDQGYEVVPIRPARDGDPWSAASTRPSKRPPRRPADLTLSTSSGGRSYTPEIARSAVATGAGALWLQLGIVNWEAARIAHDAGLPVVMDRCTRVEHRRIPCSDGLTLGEPDALYRPVPELGPEIMQHHS